MIQERESWGKSQEVSFEESFWILLCLSACHNRKVGLYITKTVLIVNIKIDFFVQVFRGAFCQLDSGRHEVLCKGGP